QGGKGRSQYRQLKWTLKDTLTILVILVLGCCLFFLKS
ncbi:energy-coupling factor transporter transmembrane protein EcfT, partial [Klebsiella pneumoniae]|nr:energy-coupling factor transporter transmembrane protein EcfT [Klebsiella pneumoniae]